ncbi:MAG: hypothetical protein KZQ66_14805 [Candidatus Thiodiazotropha sp. (ex Lucinoma aequizonata)]|nr:hypothetical protein [Candidatus Thiodiazotropha sp. (ex Lucinoma aequizonata)]MCU7894339.1 hypothetical protein [Candidatus Thiodiazotropha sp. (ex Lucinoma aequizonata)]MCU7899546.1 hypothetical protein [Candidatus Thiodiazotropha sp. (ex Lucinoma aequizonata)]MCU7903107.1 hypothetical protein [Candidatus Thiodiazotropha sp. (ex Lucinoma aequizonata)]MCU7908048.1 hypothetical protein [Candidatus Thiodiazotropha sp. (ex Lucinoma aequizonata)]
MRSLYAPHLSLSVAIPAIQPRLRLSGTKRLRSAFHDGQRMTDTGERAACSSGRKPVDMGKSKSGTTGCRLNNYIGSTAEIFEACDPVIYML